MPIAPTTYFRNKRIFVDREACTQAFRENIHKLGTQKYNVLYYYGIAGIGKSKLQKKLQRILDEEFPDIFWVSIDLNTKTYREVGTFLITLRNKIQEGHGAKFQIFNAVHAIYWKKLHPEIPLQKQNYPLIKKGDILDKIIDVLENSGKLSLAWELLNSVSDSFRKWCNLHHLDISKIESFEPNQIEELLPGIFAADFFKHFGENSKFYIFIDTYEALWEGLRDIGSYYEKDEWIRDNLIPNMLGVSWVICGREKLLWLECDADWKLYLKTQPVYELEDSYCFEFLEDCGIENKDIRDKIVKASEGVPYYLNLSVDTFEKIKSIRQPVPEDFGRTQPDIFKAFVKYLNSNEIRALKVLSAPNFWDRDLFELLMKNFDTGFPFGAFSELIEYSFIKQDTEGRNSIHKLMRKSLQEYQTSEDRERVHRFMMEYYNNKLKEIDIKTISPEHETALTEAYYHAKNVFEIKDLCDWFISVSDPFNKAALWQLLVPIYEEMQQTLEAKLGFEHIDVAKTLNYLALLYVRLGKYEKSFPLLTRVVEISEKKFGSVHPSVASSLNNLARLFYSKGEYGKALPLLTRSLEISEIELKNLIELYEDIEKGDKEFLYYVRSLKITYEILDYKKLNLALSLNNLAGLYIQIGEYEKALALLTRSLEITEEVYGPEHLDVGNTLSNLALLYERIGEYEKALSLYLRALNIIENELGPEHPTGARVLNNLAMLYGHIEDYEKELLSYDRALRISEKTLGPEHPEVAIKLNNLAGFYKSAGEYETALSLYMRALEIRTKYFGAKSLDVAATLHSLAGTFYEMEDYEMALMLYIPALRIREEALGPESFIVAETLNGIALLYARLKEYEKSLALLERCLRILKEKVGCSHPHFKKCMQNIESIKAEMEENINSDI